MIIVECIFKYDFISSGDWIDKSAAAIPHDSTAPLEIQTNTEPNGNKVMHLLFLAADKSRWKTRTLLITFSSSTYTYWMSDFCVQGREFTLPASCSNPGDLIWTVRKTIKSMTIHCNDELAVNMVFRYHQHEHCDRIWNLYPLVFIQFGSDDTASTMYRVKPSGQC